MRVVGRALRSELAQNTKASPSPWLLRRVFEAYPSSVAILDHSGFILHTNEAWDVPAPNAFFGSRYNVGQNYFKLCLTERCETRRNAIVLTEAIRGVIRGEQDNFLFRYSPPDLARSVFIVHVTRLKVPGPSNTVMVSHQAVQPPRLWEQGVLAQDEPFLRAFHFVQQPMSITTLAEGRYIDVNESFLTMLGFEREAVIGHTSLDLGIWDSREERLRFVRQLEKEGRIEDKETRLRDTNGCLRVWLSSAHLMEWQSEQCLLVASSDITERKNMEREIREVHGRLIQVQEEERSRIARELHDDISQKLALMSMELQQLSESPSPRTGEVRKRATELWHRAQQVASEIHQISYNLHPSKLDYLGLVAALRSLCHEVSHRHGLQVDFSTDDMPDELSRDVSLALFRVVQEALRNVVRHAGSTTARVELWCGAECVNLRITDSGSGFAPNNIKGKQGLGLISMRERLRLIGGEFAIRSKPSLGTQIEAKVPLKSHSRFDSISVSPDY